MAAFYMIPVQIPFYLTQLGADSGLLIGGSVAVATLMSAGMGAVYGRIQARMGYLGTLALLLVLFAAGYVVIGQGTTVLGVVAGIAVAGLGMGLLMPTLNSWLGMLAPAARRGTVLGGLTTCLFLGQFASPLLTQPIINAINVGYAFVFTGATLAVLAAGTLILLLGTRSEAARARRQRESG
jgi:MFS family permease